MQALVCASLAILKSTTYIRGWVLLDPKLVPALKLAIYLPRYYSRLSPLPPLPVALLIIIRFIYIALRTRDSEWTIVR